jgi:hypothetical protein
LSRTAAGFGLGGFNLRLGLRLLLRGRILGLRLGKRQHGAGQQKH